MTDQPAKPLLPERLRLIRKQQKLTQRELGQLCGFGINQINRFESGAREPIASNLMKIAHVLGVSIDYLVGLTDDPHGHSAMSGLGIYERELIEVFRREGWTGVIRLSAERLSKPAAP